MRIALVACVLSFCGAPALAQVDPGYWLPESKLFGATTVEHVARDGSHATYSLGSLAPLVARNSSGDVLVAESLGLGSSCIVRVLRAGVGQVGVFGPFGSISGIFVDSTDHLWLDENASFVLHQARRVSPSGTSQFVRGPEPFGRIGVNPANELVTLVTAAGDTTILHRIRPDGSTIDHVVPFKFERGWMAPSGDVVCAATGSKTIRVISGTGAVKASFDLPGLPTYAATVEPTGVFAVVTDAAPTTLSRFRLDGLPLASVPFVGTEAVNRVDASTDRTYWLLRVHPVTFVVTVQRVDYLGRVLDSFTPATGDSFTTIIAQGDLTGAVRVSVNAPNEDSDLDGFINASELELGSDPLDATSFPPTIAVQALTVLPTVLQVDIDDAARPNQPYAVIVGLSAGDGVSVNGNEPAPRIPLSMLDVAQWIQSGGFTAAPLIGVLDANGQRGFQIGVPHLPGGPFPVRFTAITADPTGFIGGIAPAVTFVLP
jgi:hypothetical protein